VLELLSTGTIGTPKTTLQSARLNVPACGTCFSIWYATGGTPDEGEGTDLRKLGTLRRSVKRAGPYETAIKS